MSDSMSTPMRYAVDLLLCGKGAAVKGIGHVAVEMAQRIAALEAESVADLVDAGWCVSVHAMPGGRVRAYAERRAKQHAGVDIADVRGDGIAAALDALRAKIGGE